VALVLADDRWCFACGTDNPYGLHLSGFHDEGEDYVCEFTPERHHQSWAGLTHGGILSTLLDEVMVRMVRARVGHAVTAEVTVRFRQPVPTGSELQLRARMLSQRGKLALTEGEVRLPDGQIAAQANAKFMLVG
jgi:uncharacterized protein (TIGR00369 family)